MPSSRVLGVVKWGRRNNKLQKSVGEQNCQVNECECLSSHQLHLFAVTLNPNDCRLYKTRLVSRPNSKDGERTTAMAYDEAKLLQDLTEQKAAFQSAYLHEWQRPYTLLLERRIKEFVADAESFIASLPKNRQGWPEEDRSIVHGYRRLAAGCAQEIELCALGIGIYAQVEEDGIFILKGSQCVILCSAVV